MASTLIRFIYDLAKILSRFRYTTVQEGIPIGRAMGRSKHNNSDPLDLVKLTTEGK